MQFMCEALTLRLTIFDSLFDNTSGKETMHDTVVIIYLFSTTDNEKLDNFVASPSSIPRDHDNNGELRPPSRKRCRFNQISRESRK